MNAQKREIEKQITCPFCKSTETEMIALFGQQMMTSQYYCRGCHSVFEAVKWNEPDKTDGDTERPKRKNQN